MAAASILAELGEFDASIETVRKAAGLLTPGDSRAQTCRAMEESFRKMKANR